MSLLLDALKKAALDKQNREQLHAHSEEQVETQEGTVRPLVSTDAGVDPRHIEDPHLLKPDPDPDPEPEPGPDPEPNPDPDFSLADEDPNSFLQADSQIGTSENLAESDQGPQAFTEHEFDLEKIADFDNDSEPVSLSEPELAPETELAPEAQQESEAELTMPDSLDEDQDFDFSLDPEVFEICPEADAEDPPILTLTSTLTPESVPTQEAAIPAQAIPEEQAIPQEQAAPEEQAEAPDALPPESPEHMDSATDPAAKAETPGDDPALSMLQREEEDSAQEGNSPELRGNEQKVAMQTLLQKNFSSVQQLRRRKILLLSALSSIAVLVVGFYYYYLSMSNQNPVNLPLAAVAPVLNQDLGASSMTQLDAAPTGANSAEMAGPGENGPDENISPATTPPDNTGLASSATGSTQLADASETSTPQIIGKKQRLVELPIKAKPASIPSKKVVATQAKNPLSETTSAFLPVKSPTEIRDNFPTTIPVKMDSPLSAAIKRGYQAWKNGDWATAELAYNQALILEPFHRDAMLGAAAVAVQTGREGDALILYQQRLSRAPRDEYARAGLLGLADLETAGASLDTEVTLLLQEFPEDAHLHFLKGSLHAARSEWHAAQQAFFEAWRWDATRADYVFNLGVSMDHLNNTGEALELYRQAARLAEDNAFNFNLNSLNTRIRQLEGAQ